MEPSHQLVKTDLWMNTLVFRGADLPQALLKLARVTHLEALKPITWSWNSFTNYRIATIPYASMKYAAMSLQEGGRVIGVAFRYKSLNFYDYDPTLGTRTFVVKVIALTDRLAETARQEQDVAFRVKHWIDCREAREMEMALWPENPDIGHSLAQVTLWENKVVLRETHLVQCLMNLASVEHFTLLPAYQWEWKNYSSYKVKPIMFNQMIQDFMCLKINGSLIGVIARYQTSYFYESNPLKAFQASVVKIYLIASSKLGSYQFIDEVNNVFGVQDYMDCHEANSLQTYLKTARCKTII